VLRAIDEETGGTVALKIARDATGRRALSREARYAALALSPRLPELLDVGWISIEGTAAEAREERATAEDAFLALRWVEGAPLSAARSRSAGDRVKLALAVARDVGEALSDLHGVGIAHGDLKPDNVIVDPLGRAHLLDLGLACALHAAGVEGATPRYLARGDSDLGDARARDMAALGAVLAEIVEESVAASENPVIAARSARLPDPVYALCAALLAPSPGARPSAAWVAETARAALDALSGSARREGAEGATSDRGERDARRVRAAYLGVRRAEMETASRASPEAAPWLSEVLEQVKRAKAIGDELPASSVSLEDPLPVLEVLEPLRAEQVARWLLALVGPPAASWPSGVIAAAPERSLAEGLTELARRVPPRAWTFGDVEAAAFEHDAAILARKVRPPAPLVSGALDAPAAARLAIAIAKVPPDPLAIEAIEQRSDAPAELLLAAADALRLQGDHGRARSLVLRASERGAPGAEGLSVEVLRRAGDIPLAEARAREAIEAGADSDGRARAALARIALARGRIDEAEAHAEDGMTAPLCEARALVATAKGDARRARAEIARGEALARTAEERARFLALRGYTSHATDPEGTLAAYAAAVDYAVRAGAVEEEATYRTGEAAAAVDLGDLGSAIGTGTRAALLYEHLGRPAHAARALLACAAAYATAGARHDAVRVAREAIARAREGADPRAEAYALWAIADTSPAGSEEGRRAAQRAASLIAGGSPEDELRAGARLLRHEVESLDRVAELDRLAGSDSALSAPARLEWWGARATRLLNGEARDAQGTDAASGDPSSRLDVVLAAIVMLADARAPVASRGPALAAGHELAIRAGQGDTAQRLLASLADAARDLVRRAPPDLLDAVRSLPWVARAAAAPESGMRPEQARDLEALINSLSERERLGPLLNRVVDAIVLWTGVERGLLLLKAPDDRLVPRAARNLARADLRGEQMTLSQTLARRALEVREPVVAVDAAGELPNVHASVHALKLRSVLAIPLIARGEALGVVYLDDRVRRGAFGPRELSWARTIASLAAVAIADARDQVLLRRAARRAKRASAELADLLAKREAALDAAERELARARGSRGTRYRYDEIVGESEATRALLKLVDRVTAADIPVLIEGESGSGKELVARAIHANGPRAPRRFVSENCGAIPEGLLESALFGHVRGAFTGADRPRAGLFEIADQGTLFLDEIGEMSLNMQTKLLRVLEDGMLRPVGSERARKVDVRIIAATHRDLAAMVKARTFREDLFYRLNIITIRIPPLRERSSDIPLIVHHLLRKHGGTSGVKPRVTQAAMDGLTTFAWPGNVRQLENEIRRALVLSDGTIDLEHLSPEIAGQTRTPPEDVGLNVKRRIDALEVALVRDALTKTQGNQTQAAKLLGLSRFGLQKMIRRLKIE
jgi:transcriptional regulator with GAF, ATPase, and Fis domain